MSDYYGDATLEDWLAEEVFSVAHGTVPLAVVALFEQWREGIEASIRGWQDSSDCCEGHRLSWRGWGRGFNAIGDADAAAFEAAGQKGREMMTATATNSP